MKKKPIAALLLTLLSAFALSQDAGHFRPLPVEEIYTAMRDRQPYVWTNAPLRDAIAKAISFSASSQTIALVSEELMTTPPAGGRNIALLRTLGTNNLSFSLMTLSEPHLTRYEIEQDVSLFAFVAGQRSLSGRSPVQLHDIVEHNTLASSPEEVTGHFVIDIPMCVRARCVYVAHRKGDSWVVQRLVISKKNSLKIEDGLDVINEDSNKESQGIQKGTRTRPIVDSVDDSVRQAGS